MLELGWDYFAPGVVYYKKAISRGLTAATMRSGTNITIDWKGFQQGKHVNLNATLQDQYLSNIHKGEKDSIIHRLNPYKFASGYFNVSQFESIIHHFMDELQSKYGTVF